MCKAHKSTELLSRDARPDSHFADLLSYIVTPHCLLGDQEPAWLGPLVANLPKHRLKNKTGTEAADKK